MAKRKIPEAKITPEAVIAEQCKRSYYRFFQEFWGEISSEELKLNWHMEYIANELQSMAARVADGKPKEKDLIVNVPPGSSKTSLVSIMFPAWCWANWYWMRFITLSYSASLSLEHAELCRDIVRSDKYKSLFPDLEIKQDKDTKSNFRIAKRKYGKKGEVVGYDYGGNRLSTSVGGTVTGHHAHIIIVDDPLDPKKAASEVELASTNNWLSKTIPTRKVDKLVTPTVLIQQRLHEDDPTGNMLAKKKDDVFHICLPGEIRNYDNISPPELKEKYVDDLLDPKRLSWQALKALESELGEYDYAGQVGQSPTPPKGGMFKVDMMPIIESMPAEVNITDIVRYWDKAGSEGKGAYTAGVKIARLRNGRWIVMDVKRGQWASEEREAIIKATADSDGQNVKVYLEQEPGSGGKESAEFTIRNLAGYSAYADRPTGDKATRARPYSAQANIGSVMLLRGGWNRDFVEEHRYFPFSKYKDQVDAAAGAFAKLTAPKIAGSIRRKR